MWSSTNQRIKALMSARAREKDRLTRPIHVRRSEVTITFRDDNDFLVEVPARVLLNDLRPEGFVVYAVTSLNPNTEVTLEVEHPKHFRLAAKVVWCQYQATTPRVLRDQIFPYRLGMALLWENAELENAFTKYCSELEELYVNKKALFLKEVFTERETGTDSSAVEAASEKNINEAPRVESDEKGAPSEEKVASEMAAAAAAEVATKALNEANQSETAAPVQTSESSAKDVLNTLKDIDPGTPAPGPAPVEEKKAA